MNEESINDCITITFDPAEHQHKRLDQFLAEKVEDLSRNSLKNLFERGLILLNHESPYKGKLELKKCPKQKAIIDVMIPPPTPMEAEAENIPLEVLYEDEHLIIINKAAGMVVHPAPGNYSGTLVNALLHHCKDLTGVGHVKRPGIVHRLDKGTSGVMVVAKNAKCHEGLVLLFSEHNIDRKYEAIVMDRVFPLSGTIESTIGRHPSNRLKMKANVTVGKEAKTFFNVINHYEQFTHIEFTLYTGRTHQIRVHATEMMNHPLLCDPAYGNARSRLNQLPDETYELLKNYPFPLLHAKRLGFVHPITKEELLFETDPNETFKKVLELAKK